MSEEASTPLSKIHWPGGRGRRTLEALLLAALALWFAVESFGPWLRAGPVSDTGAGLRDFALNVEYAREVAASGHYPAHFYYPPSAVVFFDALGGAGWSVGGLLWSSANVASALLCLLLACEVLGLRSQPHRGLIALLGTGAVAYYLQWDLRSANSNLLVLTAVLAAWRWARLGRALPAGLALAVAASFKLYPLTLLPYLAYRRRWRWLAWTTCGLAVLGVALPAMYLGPERAWSALASWLSAVGASGEAAAQPDYFKSLPRSLALVFGSASADLWARALQAAWLAAIALYFTRDRGAELRYPDLAVLCLLPLPLSPTFQPHHAVVLLLPALFLVQRAVDGALSIGTRVFAGLAVFGGFALVKAVDSWPERGLAIMASLFFTTLVMLWSATPARGRDARSAA